MVDGRPPPPGWLGKPWACAAGAAAATRRSAGVRRRRRALRPSRLRRRARRPRHRRRTAVGPAAPHARPAGRGAVGGVQRLRRRRLGRRPRWRGARRVRPVPRDRPRRLRAHRRPRRGRRVSRRGPRPGRAPRWPRRRRDDAARRRARALPHVPRRLAGARRGLDEEHRPRRRPGAGLGGGLHGGVDRRARLGDRRPAGRPRALGRRGSAAVGCGAGLRRRRRPRPRGCSARVGRFRWATAALFPVPLVFFLAVFVRSLVDAPSPRRPVRWRGRRVDHVDPTPTRGAGR